MIPYSRPNVLIYIPYPRVNCLKTIPLTAAHTYMAHIWQSPPPGLAPVQTLVMQSHLAAHQRKFISEEGGMGYSNVKVVKSHRKISSDLFAKGIEKFKAFIYLL